MIRVKVTPRPSCFGKGWESNLSSVHRTWDQSVGRVGNHMEDTVRGQSMGRVEGESVATFGKILKDGFGQSWRTL